MAGYKKILVLLDLTDASEQIAAAGRDMAAHSNAALVIAACGRIRADRAHG